MLHLFAFYIIYSYIFHYAAQAAAINESENNYGSYYSKTHELCRHII